MQHQTEFEKIILFLGQIGIAVEFKPITGPTFLPGIDIVGGRIIIDTEQLKYPGDILHEAGHIAVEEEEKRGQLHGNVEPGSPAQSLELAAILWSFAASRHLSINPAIVFHEGGYKGQSKWFIEQFESGTYIGLPLMQWMGLALDTSNAERLQEKPFPHMLKWLRN